MAEADRRRRRQAARPDRHGGRKFHVPRAAHGVARFTFAELCETPLGASDYLRLAHEFHTLVLDHIPVMQYEHRNFAKRFITLIDTLYDNGVKLVASADADPITLYRATEGVEMNEFKRTSSRLIEMGSESYLALPHGNREQQLASDSKEAAWSRADGTAASPVMPRQELNRGDLNGWRERFIDRAGFPQFPPSRLPRIFRRLGFSEGQASWHATRLL
ncbi:MAG: AFG1/ZapE family ATPase [Xanthobacteraceae bacterium]